MRKQKKRLTIKDLLAQKEQLKMGSKKRRNQTLYVESLDAEVVIQEPSRDVALEILEMAKDDEKREMADVHLVYHCVTEPNLKDEELQKQFGCVEPTDIVHDLFRIGEIAAISGHALELAGFGKGISKVDKEIKN